MKCPNCHSDNTHYRSKKNNYICDECDFIFEPPEKQTHLRVFVSYGHDEYLPFAREVARHIKAKYGEVFFDEERIKAGTDWETYIEDGLNWVADAGISGRVLLIMTPYSVRRPRGYCLNEIAKALDNKIEIIPIMLVWTVPPLSIYRLQWLDLQKSANKNSISGTFDADFAKICEALEHPYLLDKEGGLNRLMEELEPLDFGADLTLYQNWFTGRKWLFDEVKKWLNAKNSSRLFFVTGMPGIGKTAIATQLLQNFPEIGAFHLCKKEDSEKSSTRRAICTLAYQLSTQLPEYREILLLKNIKKEIARCNDVALFDTLIIQPLNRCANSPDNPLVILIDGLDEASKDGHNPIAKFISNEFKKLPERFRMIIFSRPEEEVLLPLQSFNPYTLTSESAYNQQDIRSYLEKRLAPYRKNKSYECALNILQAQADGVFLYITYVCDEIEKGNLSLNEPHKFPKGLVAFYYDYFERKFGDKNHYRANIRPVFQLLLASTIPLNEKQIKRLLNWTTDRWDDFLFDIGSFLRISNDGFILPFHTSLYEWLTNKEKSGKLFFIDIEIGKQLIAEGLSPVLEKITNELQANRPPAEIDQELTESDGWNVSTFLSVLLPVALSLKDFRLFDTLYRFILDVRIFAYLYRMYCNDLYALFSRLNTHAIRWADYLCNQTARFIEQGYITQLSSILLNSECYSVLTKVNRQGLALTQQKEIRYELMNDLGRSYYRLGNENGMLACRYLESVLNQISLHSPGDEQALNKIRLQYAIALRDSGFLEKAFPLYKEIVAWYEKTGIEDADSSWAFSNFALSLYTYNRMNESLAYFRKAIAIRKKLYGENSEEVAWIYCCYQAVLFGSGEFEEALRIAGKAYRIYENRYGKDSVKLAWSLGNYGNMLVNLGSYEEAAKCYLRSIELNDSILPARERPHMYSLTMSNALATAYWLVGKKDEALGQMETVLEHKERIFGKHHPFLANSYLNFGIMSACEKAEEAAAYINKASIIYQEKFKDTAIDTIYAELTATAHRIRNNIGDNEREIINSLREKLASYPSYSFVHAYCDRLSYQLTGEESYGERMMKHPEFKNIRIYLTHNNESEIVLVLT